MFRFHRFLAFVIILIIGVILAISPSDTKAQMLRLNDDELSLIDGSGFSSFNLNETTGVARIDLNINVATYTEIDSFKLGYWDKPGKGLGWDEDWENVKIGLPDEDFVCEGLRIQAKFSNIANPATRSLEYIAIGTPKATGSIIADFYSFTGNIGGTNYNRAGNGTRRELRDPNGSMLYFMLDKDTGFSFVWQGATIYTPPISEP